MTDLAEFLETPPETDAPEPGTAAHVVKDDADAAWHIRMLKKWESETARIHTAAEHERNRIQEWEDGAIARVLPKVEFYKGALLNYQRQLMEADRFFPKTYYVVGGSLTRVKQPDRLVIDDMEEVVAWCNEVEDGAAVKFTQKALIPELRKLVTVTEDEKVVGRDGCLVPGVRWLVGEEKFDVKLEADEDVE